jgi:small-conductance mechanosensitive channel
MDISSYPVFFGTIGSQVQAYFLIHVLSLAMVAQLLFAGFAFLLARNAAGAIRSWVDRRIAKGALLQEASGGLPISKTLLRLIAPILFVLLIDIALSIAQHFNWPREGFRVLLAASVVLFFIRFFTDQMTNRFWSRIIAIAILVWGAMRLVDFKGPVYTFLTSVGLTIGDVHYPIMIFLKAFTLLLFLYWLSRNLLVVLRFWLQTQSGLTPAVQALLEKLFGIFLFSMSIVIVLDYVGINLTVLQLFSGALGLGIGFGLQKVFANLVSGFIILADKSIKPGDVIQVGDTYGWIKFLGSRYVSVVTRDGTEHLIPNENLVTGQVINWSYSNNLVRLRVPIGISYESDLQKAMQLMLEASATTKRVLQEPKPSCLLVGFGDSAVNFELRVWIGDPENGLGSIKSDLLLGVWQRFREQGIVFPYPQRVLHHKSIHETTIPNGKTSAGGDSEYE